jgi:hypothetical protein
MEERAQEVMRVYEESRPHDDRSLDERLKSLEDDFNERNPAD